MSNLLQQQIKHKQQASLSALIMTLKQYHLQFTDSHIDALIEHLKAVSCLKCRLLL